MTLRTIFLKGSEEIIPAIPDIARLRIRVFHDWPYLYDGTMADEEIYLSHFADSEQACMAVTLSGGEVVGATTAQPLDDAHEDFRKPFTDRKIPTGKIFYFGESVLLPQFRGQGIGHTFFDLREAAARDRGAWATAFCAVRRPEDHPLRPADYSPLDPFWLSRGYVRHDELVCSFRWKDVDTDEETAKEMVFWTREVK